MKVAEQSVSFIDPWLGLGKKLHLVAVSAQPYPSLMAKGGLRLQGGWLTHR